jgi:hypothetical protein
VSPPHHHHRTFETLDRETHLPRGGYDESQAGIVFGNLPLPLQPAGAGMGAIGAEPGSGEPAANTNGVIVIGGPNVADGSSSSSSSSNTPAAADSGPVGGAADAPPAANSSAAGGSAAGDAGGTAPNAANSNAASGGSAADIAPNAGGSAAPPAAGNTLARRRLLQAPGAGAAAGADSNLLPNSTADVAVDGLANATAAGPGADTASGSAATTPGERPALSQSLPTLLAMAAALTELSRATNGSDRNVTARLLETTELLGQDTLLTGGDNATAPTMPAVFVQARGWECARGVRLTSRELCARLLASPASTWWRRPHPRCARVRAATTTTLTLTQAQYDPRDWYPLGAEVVNYGLNLEVCGLCGCCWCVSKVFCCARRGVCSRGRRCGAMHGTRQHSALVGGT